MFTGKTIVITGASSGIGWQIACDLAGKGAYVIGIGRDAARCEQARQRILQSTPQAQITFFVADLATQRQVRTLSQQISELLDHEGLPLDILINNAGLYSSRRSTTEDGIELTFAVNHLAPFLLTHLALPHMKRAPEGRVITVSSTSHYRARLNPTRAFNPRLYVGITQYGVSKLCNVLFSAEFNRRANSNQLHAWAVDPGLVNTDIGLKNTGLLSRLVWRSRQKHGTSAEVPSQTLLLLASAAREQIQHDLYWRDCQPQAPSKAALDSDLAQALWKESCRLCRIDDYFNPA